MQVALKIAFIIIAMAMAMVMVCDAVPVANTSPTVKQPDKVVYALKLKDGKYYVGATGNLPQRLDAHFTGRGAEWTRLHPPTRLLMVQAEHEMSEKKLTLQYMKRFGRSNVRGGPYTQRRLPTPARRRVGRH